MAGKGTSTPISESLVQRVTRGVKYVVTGADNAFFGPQQPLAPMAQEAQGRQWDYPTAYNLNQSPRAYEAISFAQLRALADGYDLLRLAIETRKDQMATQQWQIQMSDKEGTPNDARIKELTAFFKSPDKENSWNGWLRMILEDLLVIDAPTLYVRRTLGGQIYGFQPMDGGTIKRVITADGLTPAAPQVAYQQVLKGLPAVDYSTDELIYIPRNKRTNKVYGYSQVEQIIMTVNIALRRQISQLNFYTSGNMTDNIITMPETWNADQVNRFQVMWDSLLEGNLQERSKGRFIPGGKNVQLLNPKEAMLKDEFDEWLARIICYAFSLPPTSFVKQMNRATAEAAQLSAKEEGLVPTMNWVKDLCDLLIHKFFGYEDVEFSWVEEEAVDPLVQAQVAQIYEGMGATTADEVRADIGKKALTAEQKAEVQEKARAAQSQFGVDEKPAADDTTDEKKKPKVEEAADKLAKKKVHKSHSCVNCDKKHY